MAGVPPFSPGNLGNFMKKIREIDFWKKILQLSGVFHLDPESLGVRSYPTQKTHPKHFYN